MNCHHRRADAAELRKRCTIHAKAAAGRIVLKKYGKSVLVDADSVLAFVESLPDATIKRSAA